MVKYRHWYFFIYFACRLFYTSFNFNPFNITVMKNKNDVYTKIVLTVIAIALVGNLIKDINFVSKAHATELDLSGLKIENASNADDMVLYIYENSRLGSPGTSYRGASISSNDVPLYVVTGKR